MNEASLTDQIGTGQTRTGQTSGQTPPLWQQASWRAGLARLGGAWAGLIGLALGEWGAMAGQWLNSSTYTHVLLVPVMIGWLVWGRMALLARLRPTCWAPGLWGMGLGVLMWVAGRLSGFAEVAEAGAVAMLIASVPVALGPRISLTLLFPLAYMGFLVPMGDEMIPTLQTITARLTVALVHLSHVRATIDGVFINTPAGLFEVAQACSGVKFLVAMIAFGTFAAHICFVSWRRRAVFMVACVVVPVLANGVRAWGTIYVAQFKGAAYAGGVDHLIYGWIFFATVVACILGAFWRLFDRPTQAIIIDSVPGEGPFRPMRALPAMGAVAALALGGAGWSMAADRLAAPMPAYVSLPAVPGWQRVPAHDAYVWAPKATGADHRLLGHYANAAGDEVDVFYAIYASQGGTRKAGGFGEGAMPEHAGWAWQSPGPPAPDALSQRMLAAGPVQRLAQTSYRTGDLITGSNLALRLANFRDKALLRPRATVMLIVSAQERPGHRAADAIAAFRARLGPVPAWLDGIGAAKPL